MVIPVDDLMTQWRRERPDLDVSPQAVFGRLHRLADQTRAALIAGYAPFGLGEGEFDVMAALRRAPDGCELAPGEIARYTMVTTGAVSKRLDRLEEAGLVVRRSSASDGRSKVVGLTRAGRELIDEAFTAHIAREHRLLEPLSAQERDQLAALLEKWMSALALGPDR